jgi:flavin-dependent dehydrogenase
MSEDVNRECDVLIIGASLAGCCLARQLKLKHPEMDILVIDKKTEFDHWVGESTVEVFYDYATRVLDLGPYIWKNHMLKHGLRFFFDSAERDLSMQEMSENGRTPYPRIPAYQIDRSIFDEDLIRMNRELGIEIRLGSRMMGRAGDELEDVVTLDKENGHVVRTSDGDIRCRWLIDAGGRASPLATMMNLVKKDPRHTKSSYWARFKKINVLDKLGDDAWRARVHHTNRYLSTNHFMYRGYWIWMIPLTEDTVSLGVVFDKKMVNIKPKNVEELEAFFRTHKCLDEILGEECEGLDFLALADISRSADQHMSADRWALTGMAGNFLDPLFSGTSAQIAYQNRMIGAAIEAEMNGEEKVLASFAKHFNIEMKLKYELGIRHLDYRRNASFDVWTVFRQINQSAYWNHALPNSVDDYSLAIAEIKAHEDGCDCSVDKKVAAAESGEGLFGASWRLGNEFCDYLEEKGRYYELNRGQFHESTERESIVRKIYERDRIDSIPESYQEDLITWEAAFRYALGRMCQVEEIPFNEKVFADVFKPDYNDKQTLAECLVAMREAYENEVSPEAQYRPNGTLTPGWTPKGPLNEVDLAWRPATEHHLPPSMDDLNVIHPMAKPVKN